MRYGNIKVDQINCGGEIVCDYDASLSRKELSDILKRVFPELSEKLLEVNMLVGEYKGNKYAIRCKNITYLGKPHPSYKKRIQISDDLRLFYNTAIQNDMVPILLGVYSYKDNVVFCDFDLSTYIGKKAHNSSAHIYSMDISKAVKYGIFEKDDYFGNHLYVFDDKHVLDFLKSKLNCGDKEDYRLEIVKIMDSFFGTLSTHWLGTDCYQKMVECDYKNKFQPEWPGFYLEFCLDQYINRTDVGAIEYAQDKSKGGIDLDLYFPMIDCYGDLKAHSESSGAILGNDWSTVYEIINASEKDRSVYYIVLEHETRKDKDFQYEVTEYWNRLQNKENLHSYGDKMKYDVNLSKYYILEINRNNQQYLKVFHQGKNSNGKPRNTKIMIAKKDIPVFMIHSKELK